MDVTVNVHGLLAPEMSVTVNVNARSFQAPEKGVTINVHSLLAPEMGVTTL